MICLICKKEFKDITNTHLKFHQLSRSSYRRIDKDFDKFLSERMSKNAKGKIDVKKGRTYEDLFGKEKSDNWKRKIGDFSRGKIRPPFTQEWKDKLSKGMMGKKNGYKTMFIKNDIRLKGNKFSYIDGRTPESKRIRNGLQIKLWREAVLKRDNFTCQKTLQQGGKLVVHHIKNFADNRDLRTAISNGITLSKEAHTEFHKRYGKRNNDEIQLLDFLQS